MGADVERRLNGPWEINVNFPGRLSIPTFPEAPDDITDSVRLLTPPTPAISLRWGNGTPVGLVLSGAKKLKPIGLPVFEWTSWESSSSTMNPLKNQHYFALEHKFKGEQYATPRVCIGKIAVAADVVACQMPVKEHTFKKPELRESVVSKFPTLEQSIASAVFNVINGTSEHEGSYELTQAQHRATEIAAFVEGRRIMAGKHLSRNR